MTIVFALQKYESFDLRKSNSLAKKSKRGVTLTGRLTWIRILSSDFLEFEAPFKPEATDQSFYLENLFMWNKFMTWITSNVGS